MPRNVDLLRTESSDLDSSFIIVLGHEPVTTLSTGISDQSPHPSLSSGYNPGSANASFAHNWTSAATGSRLAINGRHLVDKWGRVVLPRGVNLSGSSKTPTNHDSSRFPLDHETVTFVNRPFPIEEAPEHFARLRRWGLTFVRLLVTWEALEHEGPGQYDQEYFSYLHKFLSLMSEYSIVAIISMHQDVWSRYSGGSGAPAWTLEAVGFDLTKLEVSGAAYLGGVREPGVENDRGRWPTGYQKLASSTMWTCFFAGDTFAPKLRVNGPDGTNMGIQTFLQQSFLNCFDRLAESVAGIESVLGFEILNEPHRGYINVSSLHAFDYNTDLHLHDTPSALQSFALGAGHPTSIPHYIRSFPFPTKISHHVTQNTAGSSVWRAGPNTPTQGECLWAMHGVWGWDTGKDEPVALRENYFKKDPRTGKEVEWYTDFWYPFVSTWATRIHTKAGADKLVFVEPIPNEFCPPSWTIEHQPRNMVFAPHWYDLNALFTKSFGDFTVNVQGLSRGMFVLNALYWGLRGARQNYELQIRNIVEAGYKALGERPIIIGECGIPVDMNGGEAFRTGNFKWQERMMDAMMSALEQNLIGFNLWNYNPDNSDIKGDYWNGENFSWFSSSRARASDQSPSSLLQTDASLDEGGRLLPVIVRPYPAKVAGIPLSFKYDVDTGAFELTYAIPTTTAAAAATTSGTQSPSTSAPPLNAHPPLLTRESEIFLPSSLAHGRNLIVHGISHDAYIYDPARQTLFIVHPEGTLGEVTVRVEWDPPMQPILNVAGVLAFYWVEVLFVFLAGLIGYFVVLK